MDPTMEPQTDPADAPDGTGPEPFPGPKHDSETEGFAPETVNLVETMSPEDQEKLAAWVVKNYELDLKSSEKFREKRTQLVKIALGMLPPRSEGQEGAQIHYPIVLTAVLRMHARVYDQQFPSNGEFFGVKPTDALDLERTVRVSKHMNWQILHKIPEYVPNHDVCIMQWLLYGSAFTFVDWDPIKNRPRHRVLRTEDVVLPYKRSSTDPSLSDLPRWSIVDRYYKHELKKIEKTGFFANVDQIYDPKNPDVQPSTGNTSRSESMQDTIDKAHGLEKPKADDSDAPRVMIQHFCYYQLPDDEDERPLLVTVDLFKKVVVRVARAEDEDQEDRARYNREKTVIEAQYQSAMMQYALDLAAYQHGQTRPPTMTPPPVPGATDMTQAPAPGPTDSTLAPGMMGPPPPAPPAKPPDPEAPKMVPIEFLTHYVCIPNPEGVYGFGIGMLLEGHNIFADVVASQIVDAGTLANTATGIKSRQGGMRGGDVKIRLGEFTDVDNPTGQLKDVIHMIEFPGPNPALGQLVKDQKEEAQELSGANEILSGEVGGSNETATTTQIRISQALAAIAILNKRYTRSRTEEGRKLARLNSVHLDDVEYFTVVDPFKKTMDGQPVVGDQQEKVGRMDYLQDVDITVTADPRMASQPQRFQEAQQAWTLVNSSPLLAQNPNLMMAVAKNLFIAMDRPELVAALMAPPPMPTGPPSPGTSSMGPTAGNTSSPPGKPPSNGPPRPQPTGPRVPNAGPTPANGEQFGGQNA